MVAGLIKFKEYFENYTDSYVLIGGAACDILFTQNDMDFRATRDLDMVLVVEALTPEFALKFWDFIKDAKYRHIRTCTGEPQFYRFDKPQVEGFPKMIELFSKSEFEFGEEVSIMPLHVDDNISSLSAILLNDDYYKVLMDGRVIENGYSVLRPEYLILFKAKAYLDLSDRANRGEKIDLSDIKKHKKDVLRLTAEMFLNPVFDLPQSIYDDIQLFITKIEEEEFDQNSLKTYRVTTEQVLARIRSIFGI